jgi:predicted lipoprotein with Yx(FWY)xxD motif
MSRSVLLVLALLCASFVATASAQSYAPTPKPATTSQPAPTATPAPTAASTPAAAPDNGPPIRKLEGHLVDIKGRGLYQWDGDNTPGVSTCGAQCRILWPPLFAEPNAQPKGPFTLAVRQDGRKQWALRGKPLYRWDSDKKYGDAGGDHVADTWHLVKVSAPKASTP